MPGSSGTAGVEPFRERTANPNPRLDVAGPDGTPSTVANRNPGSQQVYARQSGKELGLLTDRDFRAVFEASPDATLIVDRQGVIRDLNPQALSMFGWSRDEMVGFPVERLVPRANRGRHARSRGHYVKAPRPRPMGQGLELLAVHSDGTTFPVEISLSPSILAKGQGYVICTVRDISGWKRMRQLSRIMVTAAENERKRLSRELHDDLLQSLVALKIRVKLLAEERDGGKRERARVLIAGEIHEAIRGVKRMILGLLPPELDRHGLASALGSQFRDIREVYGFTVHASLDRVAGVLDGEATLALYRIIQEAVTNSVRHAQVNEATVTVRLAGGVVVAEVRDEGCGFEYDGHAGLTSMHERAAIVGGGLTVYTSPGRGTTIRAIVPVTGPDSASNRAGAEGW